MDETQPLTWDSLIDGAEGRRCLMCRAEAVGGPVVRFDPPPTVPGALHGSKMIGDGAGLLIWHNGPDGIFGVAVGLCAKCTAIEPTQTLQTLMRVLGAAGYIEAKMLHARQFAYWGDEKCAGSWSADPDGEDEATAITQAGASESLFGHSNATEAEIATAEAEMERAFDAIHGALRELCIAGLHSKNIGFNMLDIGRALVHEGWEASMFTADSEADA